MQGYSPYDSALTSIYQMGFYSGFYHAINENETYIEKGKNVGFIGYLDKEDIEILKEFYRSEDFKQRKMKSENNSQ